MRLSRLVPCLTFLLAAGLVSCGEQEAPLAPGAPAESHTFFGDVILVAPNGVDDTENIQDALDECATRGPGCTVRLERGTFYIGQPIVVADFDGHFRGAGKHRTTVQNSGDVPFPLMTSGPQPGQPSMFYFYQTTDGHPSLEFSDMTIRAVGGSEPWGPGGGWTWIRAIDVRGLVADAAEPSYLDVSFKRMGVVGEAVGDPLNRQYNVFRGVAVSGYSKPLIGEFAVIGCSFQNAYLAVDVGDLQDSHLRLTGNEFTDVNFAANFVDYSNSETTVSFNRLENVSFFALFIAPYWSRFPAAPSRFMIRFNSFHVIDNADAIGLLDYGVFTGVKTLDAEVVANRFNLETNYGAIFGFGVHDALVKANSIRGTGMAGIYMGTFVFPESNWLVLTNNVRELNASVAGIWLGPSATENTVVVLKESDKDDVLDQGTDNSICTLAEWLRNSMDCPAPVASAAPGLEGSVAPPARPGVQQEAAQRALELKREMVEQLRSGELHR